ncbi:MAG: hypothetical protein MZU97_25055 [Bacillus subtilis]|nr:hypothetical protein [Bacillus subtilis]
MAFVSKDTLFHVPLINHLLACSWAEFRSRGELAIARRWIRSTPPYPRRRKWPFRLPFIPKARDLTAIRDEAIPCRIVSISASRLKATLVPSRDVRCAKIALIASA